MATLTGKINQIMRPKAALICYSCGPDVYGREEMFLELRRIGRDGRMQEAKPVTEEFMNSLAKSYTQKEHNIPYGMIPPQMLYCDTRMGSEKYVWWNPPCQRGMYFRDGMGLENGVYNVPGVVYVVNNGHMDIYAFKGKTVTDNTVLYYGPFFNCTSGSVCLGSAKLNKPKEPTYTSILDYWEKKFWMTEFTHLGGGSNPTRTNLVLVTKAAVKAPFNEKELKSTGKKIKDIIR